MTSSMAFHSTSMFSAAPSTGSMAVGSPALGDCASASKVNEPAVKRSRPNTTSSFVRS